MKWWFLTNTTRLGVERRAVEELAASESWFALRRWRFHEGMFGVEGDITAHGQSYPVRLVYPDQFPEVPAWVEPIEEARWSTHQYGKGTLCLQLRPDNWFPDATGRDLLRSAYELLRTEDPLGAGGARAPSDGSVGEVQAYGWSGEPVLVGAGCFRRIQSGNAEELKALCWISVEGSPPIFVHDSSDRVGPRRPPSEALSSWRVELPVVVSNRSPPNRASDRRTVIESAALDSATAATIFGGAALLLFTGGGAVEAIHLPAEGLPIRREIFVLPDEGGYRSGRRSEAEGKRVAIVGAGSIGSKLSESLLRSGVFKFALADGDVMLPANLERNALDWRDVGLRKVHALKRRLLEIVPGADVQVIDSNLNWQRSARTHAAQLSLIAECDVLVDATGDPATGLYLGAIAGANDRAFVSVEVFEGGIGALVATCLPSRDPPFAAGRASFLAWCEQQGIQPPEGGSRRYEALAEDGTPVMADDAAVTMTAGHAARVVLDVLDGSPAPIDAAWLLLGYRKAWLFKGHGHVVTLNVGARVSVPELEDEEAKAFALKILKERLDEDKAGGGPEAEAAHGLGSSG